MTDIVDEALSSHPLSNRKLSRDFYDRLVADVAKDLLGKLLVRRLNGIYLSGRIVETEAYARDDPASHSFRGPTPRNEVMFGPPSHLYVYRIYGFHHCANIVTGPEGGGNAVLLRALEPVDGIPSMKDMRRVEAERLLCSGPGRLCQALGIGHDLNGADLSGDEIFVADDAEGPARVHATPRIGISVAKEKLWRYVVADSPFLSRPVRDLR